MSEKDLQERIKLVRDLIAIPLDTYWKILAGLEEGLIEVDAPQNITRLKALAQDHDRKLNELRLAVIEDLLIKKEDVGASLLAFFQGVQDLSREFVLSSAQLGMRFQGRTVEEEIQRMIDHYRQQPLEELITELKEIQEELRMEFPEEVENTSEEELLRFAQQLKAQLPNELEKYLDPLRNS